MHSHNNNMADGTEPQLGRVVAWWKWTFLTENCAICRAAFAVDGPNTGILVGTCQHAFHRACIGRWLVKRNVCPLCSADWCAVRQCECDETQ
jgi:hypothetical protein